VHDWGGARKQMHGAADPALIVGIWVDMMPPRSWHRSL